MCPRGLNGFRFLGVFGRVGRAHPSSNCFGILSLADARFLLSWICGQTGPGRRLIWHHGRCSWAGSGWQMAVWIRGMDMVWGASYDYDYVAMCYECTSALT
jgi:hypothetical protein